MARKAVHTASAPPLGAPTTRNYSQAVVAGNLVFVAGTTGMNAASGTWPDGIAAQAEQALKNRQAVLAEAGLSAGEIAALHNAGVVR